MAFVSLPVMAWIFPPEMIGKLSMLQVAINLVILLCCLGLDQAYVREYHEVDDKSGLLLNAMIPGLAVEMTLLGALWLLAPRALSMLLYGDPEPTYAYITICCLIVAYISRFLSLILRMQDRGFAYSMSQVLSKLLLLGIVLTYAYLPVSKNFTMLMAAQAGALTLTLLVFAWNTRGSWLPALNSKLDHAQIRRLFSFGWPLILGGMASWGLAAMDRIFLRSTSSYEQLAIYSVTASIASGATLVASIFNLIWAPMAYKWHTRNPDTSRVDEIAEVMLVIICLVVCLVGAMSWIFDWLLPGAYVGVSKLLPACIIPPLFYTLSEVTGIGIAIRRRTILSMLASFSAVALNVLMCVVLVPKMGATGAAIATATSFGLYFVMRTVFSGKVWNNRFSPQQYFLGMSLLAIALLFALLPARLSICGVVTWWACAFALVIAKRRSLHALVRKIMLASSGKKTGESSKHMLNET